MVSIILASGGENFMTKSAARDMWWVKIIECALDYIRLSTAYNYVIF
jgi:hypothetical protein